MLCGIQDLLDTPKPASPDQHDSFVLFTRNLPEYKKRVQEQAKNELRKAIQQLQVRTPDGQSMASNASLSIFLVGAALDIFQILIFELETEGRYLFLNAVANQLRYPNNQTHYFSFILLYLFFESNQEAIQEQITRVLLERLIVNRPHPWGL
ncbi:CCR4-NOT transcription complex subunit 1 isoform X1 [Tanacetum coccineum]